jgi:acyl dehydratase
MMSLDLDRAETDSEAVTVSWDPTRAIVYALGVGAGSDDPEFELEYTTENTDGIGQRVLPTFPIALGPHVPMPWRDVPAGGFLLVSQSIVVHAGLSPQGVMTVQGRVGKIYDKGADALVKVGHRCFDDDGRLLAETEAGVYLRGHGGFGGERGSAPEWLAPTRRPDAVVEQATMPWQALLYRLSGERSPLHTDSEIAARGGFKRPPLQGDCTFGFAGRALLQTAFGGDPENFGSMSARFVAPVVGGDVLHTSVWEEGEQILFVTRTRAGTLVLDRGVATRRPTRGTGGRQRPRPHMRAIGAP